VNRKKEAAESGASFFYALICFQATSVYRNSLPEIPGTLHKGRKRPEFPIASCLSYISQNLAFNIQNKNVVESCLLIA
jgi:hypothetical protein